MAGCASSNTLPPMLILTVSDKAANHGPWCAGRLRVSRGFARGETTGDAELNRVCDANLEIFKKFSKNWQILGSDGPVTAY